MAKTLKLTKTSVLRFAAMLGVLLLCVFVVVKWNRCQQLKGGQGPALGPAKIVFERGLEIYVMNLDGSGQKRLTEYPRNGSYAKFSADRSKIIFTSGRDGYGRTEIYVMNAD